MLHVDSKILDNHTYQPILMPTNQTTSGPKVVIGIGFKNMLMLFYLYVDGSFLLTLLIVEWEMISSIPFIFQLPGSQIRFWYHLPELYVNMYAMLNNSLFKLQILQDAWQHFFVPFLLSRPYSY